MTDYSAVSLERDSGGWRLRIHGFADAAHLGAYIWPHGVPERVRITMLKPPAEPDHIGEFEIQHVDLDALQHMDQWWSAYFTDHSVMTADEPAPEQHGRAGAHQDAPAMPDAEARERAEQLREYLLNSEHGYFTVGEIVGMFSEHGTELAEFGEVAGAFGDILAVAVVLYSTWHAFGEGLRAEEERGEMFGLFWQVIGHPDQEPMYNHDDFYAKLPWDSWDEMKKSFDAGVVAGRAKAMDVKTHNRFAAAIAWRMHANGEDENTAASLLLNEVWQHATGGTKHQFVDFP